MSELARVQDAVFKAVWKNAANLELNPRFARAVQVHHDTCQKALQATLAIGFPALRAHLGDAPFAALAAAYAIGHPPTSAWLEDYGDGFPDFVATSHCGLAACIGRIDAAVNRALHSDPAPARGQGVHPLASLANLSDGMLSRVCLVVHPAFQLLASTDEAALAWSSHALGEPWPAVAAGSRHLLVHRTDIGVTVEPAEAELAELLQHFCRGGSLADAFNQHRDAMQQHLPSLARQSIVAGWTTQPNFKARGEAC